MWFIVASASDQDSIKVITTTQDVIGWALLSIPFLFIIFILCRKQ